MALNEAIILGNGRDTRGQRDNYSCSSPTHRFEIHRCGCGDIHIDLIIRLPNAADPRLASIHREAINRAQQVLSRLRNKPTPR
jgi:hypothetical protein